MFEKISQITNLKKKQIEAVISLTEEGYTIPFIARYRKEQTDYLDEIEIKLILEEYDKIIKLNTRREEIIATLIEREQLTPKLKALLEEADKISLLEEIYKPYKKKQKTKTMIARGKRLRRSCK